MKYLEVFRSGPFDSFSTISHLPIRRGKPTETLGLLCVDEGPLPDNVGKAVHGQGTHRGDDHGESENGSQSAKISRRQGNPAPRQGKTHTHTPAFA